MALQGLMVWEPVEESAELLQKNLTFDLKAKHSPEVILMVSETNRHCIRREEYAGDENIAEPDTPMNKNSLENNFCFPSTLACMQILERSFQEKSYWPAFTWSIRHQEDVEFPPGHGLFSSVLRCVKSYPQTISFPLPRRIAEVSQCWKGHKYCRREIRAKIWPTFKLFFV